MLTTSGFGTAVVGFGAKALLENLLSGVMIYLFHPFTVGDWIELPDKRLPGTARTIGSYYTELLTAEREPLLVPNALFAGFAVANDSRRDHRRACAKAWCTSPPSIRSCHGGCTSALSTSAA
ncbi:MAG: mechanosensitive ion channel family protein [Cyanobacteria bacterium]|nr:mechanosensitive ion channel family protein [Cyanobacteriota bacterium]